jgi:hypothetical protein
MDTDAKQADLMIEEKKLQMDTDAKQADLMIEEKELALKERDMALKEFEAQRPEPDPGMKIQADMQMAREKMEFEASEADKQRQVDLAKAIMSEFNGPEVNMTSPEDALARASEIMARINEVISATREVGGMPLEETTVMVMDNDDDEEFLLPVEPVLQ